MESLRDLLDVFELADEAGCEIIFGGKPPACGSPAEWRGTFHCPTCKLTRAVLLCGHCCCYGDLVYLEIVPIKHHRCGTALEPLAIHPV